MNKGKIGRFIIIVFLIGLILAEFNISKNQISGRQVAIKDSQLNMMANFDWDPPITLPVGDTVITLYVGDANNDGHNDIVTANDFNSSLSIILWNTTSHTWNPEIRKTAAPRPIWVVIADVNNDGYNDIVVAKYGSPGRVGMFLWNKTKTDWDAERIKNVTNEPRTVFVGDATNDGYNDIVTCSGYDGSINILPWNVSKYDWDLEIKHSVGGSPIGVVVNDVNNDGYNDVVVANWNSASVSILLWNSNTKIWDPLITKTVGAGPYHVFVADANNDGYNDIATANLPSNSISLLLWNASAGTWDKEIRKTVGVRPNSLFIGDANIDGWNDIVVPNEDDYNVSIFLWNTTTATWDAAITRYIGANPMDIFVVDVNDDEINDIVVCNSGNLFVADDNVTILLGKCIPDIPVLAPLTPNPNENGTINLNWTYARFATVYYIYRNTSKIESVIGMTPLATVASNNYSDILYENRVYHYVIVAGNTLGNSSLSNCENVTLTIPLKVPILQPLTPIGHLIDLSWSTSPNAIIYYLYRSATAILNVTSMTPIATISTNTTQDLVPGDGTYYYAVVAGDGFINSTPSDCENITLFTPIANSAVAASYPFGVSSTINWTVTDDGLTGFYRVLRNDSEYISWNMWSSGVPISIFVNTSSLGIWNYTLQYNDSVNLWGIPNIRLINITENLPPISNTPAAANYVQGAVASIPWALYDDVQGGYYCVLKNETLQSPWSTWTSGVNLTIPVNTTLLGVWNYTIQYNDSAGIWGMPHTVLITIVIDLDPIAFFLVNKTWISVGDFVNFTFTGIEGNTPAIYEWDFGDGSPNSTQKNPIHQYNSVGNFSVHLKIIDADGDTDTFIEIGLIYVNGSPSATFLANSSTISVGTWVQFTFTGIKGNEPVMLNWSFGDGPFFSTAQNPIYKFETPGIYNVTLLIVDNDGESSSYSMIITVKEGSNGNFLVIIIGSLIVTIVLSCVILYYKKAKKRNNALKSKKIATLKTLSSSKLKIITTKIK